MDLFPVVPLGTLEEVLANQARCGITGPDQRALPSWQAYRYISSYTPNQFETSKYVSQGSLILSIDKLTWLRCETMRTISNQHAAPLSLVDASKHATVTMGVRTTTLVVELKTCGGDMGSTSYFEEIVCPRLQELGTSHAIPYPFHLYVRACDKEKVGG